MAKRVLLCAALLAACGTSTPPPRDCESRTTYFVDADADGHGAAAGVGVEACDAPAGYVTSHDDCDDAAASRHPGAPELCDAADVDEDCDGAADDTDSGAEGKTIAFADVDGDGHGDANDTGAAYCDPPAGMVAVADDCDDAAAAVHPGAVEVCDVLDVDEDCENGADEGDVFVEGKTLYWPDDDHDTFGNEHVAGVSYCDAPAHFVTDHTDCDDALAGVNPSATEVCDGGSRDEDCNGLGDEADPAVTGLVDVFLDADDDGYGAAGSAPIGQKCLPGLHESINDDDCDDDNSPDVNPGQAERCDPADIDEDCDGAADDADAQGGISGVPYFADADGDGHRGTAAAGERCDPTPAESSPGDDCDEANAGVFPGAPELCDGLMNDCAAGASWTLAAEDGRVTHFPVSGAASDITSAFSTATYSLPANGEVVVCPGLYGTRLVLPAGALTVRSRGANKAAAAETLIVTNTGSLFRVQGASSLRLDGLTLAGGRGTFNGQYTVGGAVYVDNIAGSLVVSDSRLINNQALVGAAIEGRGSIAVDGCEIGGIGIGLYNSSVSGGAIGITDGELTVTNSVLSGNSGSGGSGGAIYARYTTITMTNTSIEGNSADAGGGIHLDNSTMTMSCDTATHPLQGIRANAASSVTFGGAGLSLSNSSFTANGCYFGGPNGDENLQAGATDDDILNYSAGNAHYDFDGVYTTVSCDTLGCVGTRDPRR